MKYSLPLTAALLGCLLCSCVSSRTVGYADGAVKTSNVAYRFRGPPLLQAGSGQTYRVQVSGVEEAKAVKLSGLEERGMRITSDAEQAFLSVDIALAEAAQGEASAMKIKDEWLPAFEVKVPYEIVMTKPDGTVLAQHKSVHTDFLTFDGKQRFPTKEQAIAALDFAKAIGKEKAEAQARQSAYPKAVKEADKLAAGLFEMRNISMDVPVVRSAAGLEFEEAFEILAAAENPGEVSSALGYYQRAGTQQLKADGSANNTANYGVACGTAACQLMLGSLSEAWESASIALTFQPDGEEVNAIRRVIYEQEVITGVSVIPEDERREIDTQLAQAQSFAGFLNKLAN